MVDRVLEQIPAIRRINNDTRVLRVSFSRELFVSGVSLILNAKTMAGALIPKPNVISPVLEHFGFQPNEKGEPANLDEPMCKICGKWVPVTHGNT